MAEHAWMQPQISTARPQVLMGLIQSRASPTVAMARAVEVQPSMADRKRPRSDTEKLFGEILRQIRGERGLSQEDLGFESGYHRTYISLLERGQKNPSLKVLFRLSEVLEVKPSDIIRQIENRMKG